MTDNNYDSDKNNELLSQYLDGELDSGQSLELKRRLLAEPELRAQFDRLQRVSTRVQTAFNQAGLDSVPHDTRALLEHAPISASSQLASAQRRPFLSFAVAASIAVAAGVIMVPKWGAESTLNPISNSAYDVQLSQTLESTPSMSEGWAQLEDGRAVRPILSFKADSGTWCREFLVQQDSSAERGIACRSNNEWNIEVLAATEVPGSANEYRPAGSSNQASVSQYMAEKAVGVAAGKEEEAQLIATQWQ
ncbi:MAG: hypothetical protein ABJ013_07510 [Halioglobus sp.]